MTRAPNSSCRCTIGHFNSATSRRTSRSKDFHRRSGTRRSAWRCGKSGRNSIRTEFPLCYKGNSLRTEHAIPMTWNRRAQGAMIAIFFCVLAAIYALAWSLPAVGFDHDDAGYLVAANAIAGGHGPSHDPPLFPAVLALFTFVSRQPQWLKLLPLACTAGWLALTRKLLLKMGASKDGALLLAGLA